MRCKVLSAVAACLLASIPSAAETWSRIEILGALGGSGGVYGFDAFGLGAYHPRYGIGVGTRLMEARWQTWDLSRKGGLPDASAHALLMPVPLEVRVILASWEGGMFRDTSASVESTNGRVELFGSYCPWAYFGQLNEVQTDRFGSESRDPVPGFIRTQTLDWGLMYDAGKLWSVSVGRFEFRTREGDVFRSRRDGRWYAMARVYWGRTHGKTIGSSPLHIFRDAGHKLCRLVGQCKIIDG